MNPKVVLLIAVVAAGLGSLGGARVLAQAPQAATWQLVASSGGDGGVAWKINSETGQVFFCYRANCFVTSTSAAPPR